MGEFNFFDMAREQDRALTFEDMSTATLTKAHLAEALFERIGLSKREAKDVVEAFFDIIAARLIAAEDGEEVKITGFGNFRVRSKNPRPGRNPRTGALVPIAARRVITFHASAKLKGRVQGETDVDVEDED